MRMTQSPAQLERAFVEETHLDRRRRESLRQATIHRAQQRTVDRQVRRTSLRFVALAMTLLLTAVIVTVAMFRAIYLVIG